MLKGRTDLSVRDSEPQGAVVAGSENEGATPSALRSSPEKDLLCSVTSCVSGTEQENVSHVLLAGAGETSCPRIHLGVAVERRPGSCVLEWLILIRTRRNTFVSRLGKDPGGTSLYG